MRQLIAGLKRNLGAVVIAAVVVLGGCSTPAPVQKLPELRFTQFAPITLDVSRIEVTSQYQPPFKEPNVEHLMPKAPAAVAAQWAQDRLRATGTGDRTAVFVIRDGSVTEAKLPVDESMKAFFKKQQSERYEGRLDVVVEVRDGRGMILGEASATAARGQTVAQDITVDERNRIWFDLARTLGADMNSVLENNMRQYLNRYVIQRSVGGP
ncbi:MAG: hypothetical protein ABT940_04920 [Alphaproteobacteria bacterium]